MFFGLPRKVLAGFEGMQLFAKRKVHDCTSYDADSKEANDERCEEPCAAVQKLDASATLLFSSLEKGTSK